MFQFIAHNVYLYISIVRLISAANAFRSAGASHIPDFEFEEEEEIGEADEHHHSVATKAAALHTKRHRKREMFVKKKFVL